MRISYKIIFAIWIVLLAGMGALIYHTYSRLQPDTFISLLKHQIEKNYPGSIMKIGNMDYRPGLDLSLKFQDIEVIRPEGKLGGINELEVRVPWWLLISDRGNAQINISGLELFISRDEAEGAYGSPSSPGKKSPAKIKVSLPDYLTHAKYTLRAKDIMIRDARDSSRKFALSKLLVKEFQYGKNSAFELNLPIEINHNKAKFTSELWLFGDLTPDKDLWRLNFRGEFKTRDLTDNSNLEDLAIDGKADFKPGELNLFSAVSFLIERQKVGEGKIIAGKSDLSMDFQFTAFPLEYLGIFSQELKNPYLPSLTGPSTGMVHFQRTAGKDALELVSRFSFDGTFPVDSSHTYAGKWQFTFSDAKWETSFITPHGEVSFFRRSIIDVPRGEVVQFIEEIGFMGIELDPAMTIQMSLPQFRSLVFPHYYSSQISLKDCLQGETKVSGSLFHGFTPHERFYQLNLQGNGSLKLNYLSKEKDENFSLEATDFHWSPGYKFLDPFFAASEGVFTGKVDGKWSETWNSGTWLSQLKATGLKSPSGQALALIQKLWSEFTVDSSGAPDQTWNVSLKDNTLMLNSLTIDSADPAKLTGTVAPAPKKSHLVLTYPKNKKWKSVRKDLPEFTW
jgi:hypothetical protein